MNKIFDEYWYIKTIWDWKKIKELALWWLRFEVAYQLYWDIIFDELWLMRLFESNGVYNWRIDYIDFTQLTKNSYRINRVDKSMIISWDLRQVMFIWKILSKFKVPKDIETLSLLKIMK